jgi:hypothetical protein
MSAMSDAFALLALPFAASVVFVLMHAYLGVHVLRRRIVFADLALAQLSALGATSPSRMDTQRRAPRDSATRCCSPR